MPPAPLTAPWRSFAATVLCLAAALPAGRAMPDPAIRPQPESNRRMAALLERITAEADPRRNPFRSTETLPLLRAEIARTREPSRLLELRMQLVQHLVQAGQPEEALAENRALQQAVAASGLEPPPQWRTEMSFTNAVCLMRLAEQENCREGHNADSCLFPIQGGGVHQLKRGSRGAVDELVALLREFPGELRARWLLNVAAMTLGEHPQAVPEPWRIDPALFASDHDIKRFPDVAGALGIAVDGLAGGVVFDDLDDDGFLDLMVSSWGLRDQLRLFRNQGDGTFAEHTAAAGLTGLVSGLNLVQCDYNNDGRLDVLVLRGAWLHTEGNYPLSLLRNDGGLRFTDVTEQAGLLRFRPTQAAVWLDYDGDGWLDLYVGNESTGRNTHPCELFRNNGDGTFTESATRHGVDFVGFFKGVTSADYNHDGRPDLFLSRRDGPSLLLRNDGPAGADRSSGAAWRFTDVTEEAGVGDPPVSFPCWFFDYDNDSWPDLLVTGYAIQDVGDVAADCLGLPHGGQRTHLYRNRGDGTFEDVSRAAGVHQLLHTMGCNFGDLDNDGWLDFYVGTGDPNLATLIPNRMFRNDGGRRFQDVTTAGGFGQLQKGHGIAFGDIDNDGDQDIYSVVGGAVEADHYPNQLFANPGHGHRWIKLKLEGVHTNRAAVGARLKVVTRSAEGRRELHRTVGSGASFGAAAFLQHVGLGPASAIERVEVFWPVTGRTDVFTGLQADSTYLLREDAREATPVVVGRFQLPGASAAGPHVHPHTHGHADHR